MKTSIRILAVLLAMVLCFGLLAGCGEQKPAETKPAETKPAETKPAETQPAETQPAAPQKNADIYPLEGSPELEVLVVNGTASKYADREVVATWEKGTGVHINWVEVADNAAYTTYIAGGNWSDVIMASGIDKATLKEYGDAGKLVNLAEYKDLMPNVWRAIELYDGAYETIVNDDGTIYTLPYLCNTTTVGSPLYFRSDMAEAAGLSELPTTIEEFFTWLEGWQNYYGKDGAEFYCFIPYSSGDMNYAGTLAGFFFPAFGELVTTKLHEHNGKIVLGAATEQFKLYLQFMNKLYNTPGFYTESFVADPNFTKGLITEGKTGLATTMTHLTKNAFPSGNFDIYGLKPLTSEYWSTPHVAAKNVPGWSNFCLTTACEDIETACRWMDAFFAPIEDPLNDEGTIWGLTPWRGELGVNFEFVNDGAGYRSFVPEGYASHLAWITDHYITSAYVGDVPYIDDADSALSRKSYIMGECMDPYAEAWGNVTYLSLSSDDQDEYATLWTDIDKYLVSMNSAFITGEKDIEAEWDTYIETLNKMGLETIIEIYQNAYDAQNG